jgi:hypothetical protein
LDIQESGLIWEPHRHVNHTIKTINGGLIVGQYEEVYGGENTLPSVTISLDNIKYISELPRFTFGGHLELILINNVIINKIYSYAFTNLRGKIEKIEIKNSIINYIDAQAFKRIYLDNFIIINSNINKFESRSFYECRVKKEFKFENVTIDEIASSAIGITGPLKTSINACNFSHISGESFKILTRGTITIADNTFGIMDTGALYGFKPLEGDDLMKDLFLYNPAEHESPHTVPSIEDGYKPENPNNRKPELKIKRDFILQNNTIINYSKGALKISNRYKVTFQKIVLSDTNCDCKITESLIVNLLGIPDSPDKEFASPPAHDTSQLQRTTWCRLRDQYVTLPAFRDESCVVIREGSVLYVALGVAALVLIIIVLISVAILFWFRSKRKKDPQQKKIMMVVPDTRTYRETELQVIVERVEPIPPCPETHQLLTPNNENNRHVSFQH